MSLIYIFIFVLGIIIGSFLNVVGLRFGSGRSLSGRSSCPHCSTTLTPIELVPILSFLFLRGKCMHCSAPISFQYPLIEVFTGLVFLSLFKIYGFHLEFLLVTLTFCFYIAIIIYDYWHKIIPNTFVYPAIALSLIFRLLTGGSLADWLIGPILFGVFALGWFLTKGRALGFADGKLALSIGLLLGADQGLSAVVLAFWIGTAIVVPIMIYGMIFGKNKLTMKSEIPLGPFLVLGTWVSLLLGLDLFHLSLFS